ncbi:hypothetical protein V8E55_010227, partial [Tylopilus felleus]
MSLSWVPIVLTFLPPLISFSVACSYHLHDSSMCAAPSVPSVRPALPSTNSLLATPEQDSRFPIKLCSKRKIHTGIRY